MTKSLALFAALVAGAAAQTYSVQDANKLAAAGNWNGLLDYAKAWTAAQPASALAWRQLGDAYAIGLRDMAGGSEAYEHAVALNEKGAEAWNLLGCAYALSDRIARAIPAFQHAVDTDPHKPAYWANLQAAYLLSGNPQKAEEVLNRAAEIAGAYADAHAWYVFANAYAGLHRNVRAIALYDKAVAMNLRFAEAYNNRGSAEEADGQWRVALADYQRAAGLGDPLAPANARNLQAALTDFQRKRKTIEKVTKALTGQAAEYPKGHGGAAHSEAAFPMGR